GSAGARAPGSGAARGRHAPRVEQRARRAAGSKAGRMSALFAKELSVLNLGISRFADAIKSRGGAAAQLDWAPPAAGDRAAGEALAGLINEPKLEAANVQAVERYLAAQPKVTGIGVARDVLPGMKERMILHAGPPIAWKRMCGPMRGAIIGAILYEGWTDNAEKARALAESGEI